MLVKWLQNSLKGDPIIWSIVFLLCLISTLVVYSATGSLAFRLMDGNTEYYLFRHSMMIALSLFAMWVAHRIDYRYYSKISRFFLWISVPLLIFTWKFGVTLNEASRWVSIPFINQIFQPSDLAKLALITNLAAMLSKRQQNIDDLSNTLVPMLLWCGLICGLIAMTNFSTAILLLLTCMLVLFLGRVPMKYLLMLLFIGILAGAVAFSFGQRGSTVVSRVKDFVNPTEVPYQAQQSFIAIATGGVAGKGPGNSDQKNFLPYPYSDFIYSIIIEEYGMAGGIIMVLLYLALLYRGMMTASKSDRAFGGLLSAGLSFALVMQAMINMGVAVGLGPITGLPLPLVSMGGTSLLFTGITLGIILSVSRGEIEDNTAQVNEIRNVPKAA